MVTATSDTHTEDNTSTLSVPSLCCMSTVCICPLLTLRHTVDASLLYSYFVKGSPRPPQLSCSPLSWSSECTITVLLNPSQQSLLTPGFVSDTDTDNHNFLQPYLWNRIPKECQLLRMQCEITDKPIDWWQPSSHYKQLQCGHVSLVLWFPQSQISH